MNLSKEGAEALERLRTGEYAIDTAFDDAGIVVHEMMNRLYPVRTLNGLVIRWDDPVTPERLVASGGVRIAPETVEFVLPVADGRCNLMFQGDEVRVPSRKWLPVEARPTNMNEVWQLMAKCGCPVGGVE